MRLRRDVNTAVTLLAGPAAHALPVEIVEHKGIGHPDTICDALAETFSRTLSRFYLERFGEILHHNVDKALLCGGAARPQFGAGEVLEPIEIHLAGRAVCEFKGVSIPVQEIAVEGSRQWLSENLSHLDVQADVRIVAHVRPTSADLASVFRGRGGLAPTPLANDTSFGVGYAPLDALETAVLAVASRLNSRETRRAHPAVGEDIKVMGLRQGAAVELTVACAVVGRYVADMAGYAALKDRIRDQVLDASRGAMPVSPSVAVNAADGDTPASIYLTVTGLSAEAGDDGQVGGLITPYRPMSLEAVAGKNPVTHVGKLYSFMAQRIAAAVVAAVPDVVEAHCYLLSRIGQPIAEPRLFEVKVRLADGGLGRALALRIEEVARDTFGGIGSFWREAVDGAIRVW